MQDIVITPSNVCSRQIHISVDDNGVVTKARFVGGCPGNTLGIAHLIVGMKAKDVVDTLLGIKCPGSRTGETSCPDQLAQGIKKELSL